MGVEGLIRRLLPALLILVCLHASTPSSAVTELWTDEFNDVTRVSSQSGLSIGGGVAALREHGLERQGIQISSGADLLSPALVVVGSQYFLYFAECSGAACSIVLSVSPDANAWTGQGVVVSPGLSGSTDSFSVAYEDAMLIGSMFHMWYAGVGLSGWYSLHHAHSTDGRAWTSDGLVLSGTSDGSGGSVYAPSVLWDGLEFTMWYTTFDGANTWIRRALSSDGITWNSTGIVLSPRADGLEDDGPRFPAVIRTSTGYIMWYTCASVGHGRLCRAESSDGIDWTRQGIALDTDPGLPGESLDLAQPEVLIVAPDTYRIWYVGRGSAGIIQIFSAMSAGNFGGSGTLVSIPIAVSSGLRWVALFVTKQEPTGTSIRVTVLDATSGGAIAGLSDLVASVVSLASIDPLRVPTIRLQASFHGDFSSTPLLDSWTVSTKTAPPSPRMPVPLSESYSPFILVGVVILAAGIGLGILAVMLLRLSRRPSVPSLQRRGPSP